MSLIVGKFGDIFIVSTGYDMSSGTLLTIKFTKSDGSLLIVSTPDVTAPAVDLIDDGVNYPASTYMQYVTQDGDINVSGVWKVCATYSDGTPKYFPSLTTSVRVYPAC